jgi:signal recognition particle subunit SRP54
MLEKLGEVLRKATNKIANAIFLDKDLVDSVIRDLQRALIEADVNVALVKELSDKMKKEAMDERIKGVEKKEHIIKILHDELLKILGEYKPLKLEKTNRIMFLGLYGAGKTTTIAKLGNYYAKRGYKAVLIGLDTHRPAAKEQLKQLAEKNKLNFFTNMNEKNPGKIWEEFEKLNKKEDYNLILIDTAGRHTLDKELIAELKELDKKIKPTEKILVMPADIGQAAKTQAKEFREAVSISGIIITRMDSTAKAGGALTACAETNSSVYFIATGEKINDIEEFNPKSFLSRLLDMGDLQALIEKIKSVTNEDEILKAQKKIEEGKLSLEDVIEQVKSMNTLGGFEKIKSLIPGFSGMADKIPEGTLENQQGKIAKWEHIIKSMTQEEKENPEILEKQTSRIARIASGAGVHTSDVRSLLKQYNMLNDMMKGGMSDMDVSKGMSQKQMMKFAKKFMKKGKMRF